MLIVAGSDSGGGAGIQADIKTVTALGGFATTAVTALTAQNTRGIQAVQALPAAFVVEQMRSVLDDIGTDAIKTGMLHDSEIVIAVAAMIDQHARDLPLVVDPVTISKSGETLLAPEAMQALKARILLNADILTPNLDEAESLTGMRVRSVEEMVAAAHMLITLGPAAVLVKGGHLGGANLTDVLLTDDGVTTFEDTRIETSSTHGTGCSLASAIAAGLARGRPMGEAVALARLYVREAIRTAPGFGDGHGPLTHAHTVDPAWAGDEAAVSVAGKAVETA